MRRWSSLCVTSVTIELGVAGGVDGFDVFDITENVLITHKGMSGPAILQISSYWQKGDNLKIKIEPNFNTLTHLDLFMIQI